MLRWRQTLNNLGMVRLAEGDLAEATALLERADLKLSGHCLEKTTRKRSSPGGIPSALALGDQVPTVGVGVTLLGRWGRGRFGSNRSHRHDPDVAARRIGNQHPLADHSATEQMRFEGYLIVRWAARHPGRMVLLPDHGAEDVFGESLTSERGERLGAGVETRSLLLDQFEQEALSQARLGQQDHPLISKEVLRHFGERWNRIRREGGRQKSHSENYLAHEKLIAKKLFNFNGSLPIMVVMLWRLAGCVFGVTMGLLGVELRLLNPTLPVALAGRPYHQGPLVVESSGRCQLGTTSTRLVDGTLPTGISLDGMGYLRGTPVELGRFGFTVELRSGCSRSVEQVVLEVAMAPLLRVSTKSLDFSCEKGGRPPAMQRVMISGSHPGMPYTMSAVGAPWLEIRPRRGALPPPGAALETDAVDLLVHPEKLESGNYHATLLTYAWGGTDPASTEVHLTVKPAGSSLDTIRTVPMLPPPPSAAPLPIVIAAPAFLEPPPSPKPKPVPVVIAPPAPKKPLISVTRSRIVTVPRITLPEAVKGPSKLLGEPEPPKPPSPKPTKKSGEGGGGH